MYKKVIILLFLILVIVSNKMQALIDFGINIGLPAGYYYDLDPYYYKYPYWRYGGYGYRPYYHYNWHHNRFGRHHRHHYRHHYRHHGDCYHCH